MRHLVERQQISDPWRATLLWKRTDNLGRGRIPGTGEPGGLPSMGSHRVRHDWSDLEAAAHLHKLEKKKTKPKFRRRKKITKARVELGEIETKETIEKKKKKKKRMNLRTGILKK